MQLLAPSSWVVTVLRVHVAACFCLINQVDLLVSDINSHPKTVGPIIKPLVSRLKPGARRQRRLAHQPTAQEATHCQHAVSITAENHCCCWQAAG